MSTDGKISRRKWLIKSALLTAAAGVPPLPTSTSFAESKASKSVVHYQDHPKQMQMCGMCKFFISAAGGRGGMMGGGMMGGGMMGQGMMGGGMMGGGMMGQGMMGGGMAGQGMMAAGACQVVEGKVSPMGWCVLYSPAGA